MTPDQARKARPSALKEYVAALKAFELRRAQAPNHGASQLVVEWCAKEAARFHKAKTKWLVVKEALGRSKP